MSTIRVGETILGRSLARMSDEQRADYVAYAVREMLKALTAHGAQPQHLELTLWGEHTPGDDCKQPCPGCLADAPEGFGIIESIDHIGDEFRIKITADTWRDGILWWKLRPGFGLRAKVLSSFRHGEMTLLSIDPTERSIRTTATCLSACAGDSLRPLRTEDLK